LTARRKAASSATFDGKEDAKLVSFNRTCDIGKAEGSADAEQHRGAEVCITMCPQSSAGHSMSFI
jgi:hypothetical protein